MGKLQIAVGLLAVTVGALGEVLAAVAPKRSVGGSAAILLLGLMFVALGARTVLDDRAARSSSGRRWETPGNLRARRRLLTCLTAMAAIGVITVTVTSLS